MNVRQNKDFHDNRTIWNQTSDWQAIEARLSRKQRCFYKVVSRRVRSITYNAPWQKVLTLAHRATSNRGTSNDASRRFLNLFFSPSGIVDSLAVQHQSHFDFYVRYSPFQLFHEGTVPDDYSKLPLRERLTIAEHMTRELSEHLDQGFLPKIETLRRVTKHRDGDSDVTDKTVRDSATSVRDSEKYTAELYEKLQGCLQSIASEVESMVHG